MSVFFIMCIVLFANIVVCQYVSLVTPRHRPRLHSRNIFSNLPRSSPFLGECQQLHFVKKTLSYYLTLLYFSTVI